MKWQQDQEFLDLVVDLLDHDDVKQLETFVHHKVTNRLAHSLSVAYRSFRWARRLGLNKRAVARAGLLHDLFFYECLGKESVGGKGHYYEHPRIAIKNAEKITELSDLERDIILKHMFGATLDIPKYPESWIVTLMDKQSAIYEWSDGVKKHVLQQINNIYKGNLALIKSEMEAYSHSQSE